MSFIFILFIVQFCIAQQTDSILTTKLINSFELVADEFMGFDEFDNLYYVRNNSLHKKKDKKTVSYSNTQLGKITSVDIKNPLKIILFYSDFNTVIILDNKLNELSNRIDFSNNLFSKNVSLVTGSSTNSLWLYSSDDNTLQSYNYQTEKVQLTSQPLSFTKADFKVKKLVSSYKNCWILGENGIIQFNEYGTLLNQIEINEVRDIVLLNDNYVYLKNNKLYKGDENVKLPIELKKEISIESFYVNKDEIYIFDGTSIFVFLFTKK